MRKVDIVIIFYYYYDYYIFFFEGFYESFSEDYVREIYVGKIFFIKYFIENINFS